MKNNISDQSQAKPLALPVAENSVTHAQHELPERRDIEIITEEILIFKSAYIESAYDIGKLLLEAKGLLEHGQWLDWLRDRINFSERTAHRFMQLAKGYPNSSTLANMGFSKSLCLLALPEIERIKFVNKTHRVKGGEKTVEAMSSRELSSAVQEYNNEIKGASKPVPISSKEPKNKKNVCCYEDFQYVQQRIDEMLDIIEKLIDSPASYKDLSYSMCNLCEEILQKLTPEMSEE